jgi:hypothetical protein
MAICLVHGGRAGDIHTDSRNYKSRYPRFPEKIGVLWLRLISQMKLLALMVVKRGAAGTALFVAIDRLPRCHRGWAAKRAAPFFCDRFFAKC